MPLKRFVENTWRTWDDSLSRAACRRHAWSLVVLKIAAYLDRPRERDTDLADIAHIMSEYVGSTADRRWSDEIVDLGMDFEDVSPFVLGQEIGALVDAAERRLLQKFFATIEAPEDPLSTLHRMAERAPAAWRDPARLRLRLSTFRRGIETQPG
jgi:predicted nucleotidyltransferase